MNKKYFLLNLALLITPIFFSIISFAQNEDSNKKENSMNKNKKREITSNDTLFLSYDKDGKLLTRLPAVLKKSQKFLKINIEKDTDEISEAKKVIEDQAKKAQAVINNLNDNSDFLFFLTNKELKSPADISVAIKNISEYIDKSKSALLDSLQKNGTLFQLEYFNAKSKWIQLSLKDSDANYSVTITIDDNIKLDELNIRITHTNVLNDAIIRYYNVMADSLVKDIKLIMKQNAAILSKANQLLIPYRSLMDSLIQFYPIRYGSKCAESETNTIGCPEIDFSPKRVKELDCLLKLIICNIKYTKEEAKWLKYFLLLNGGKIQFDPFKFSDEEDLPLFNDADSLALQENNFIKKQFTTISKIKNSSIINLKTGKEQETRNYYYNQSPFANDKKFGKAYPDDYEITHLIHNVPDSLKIKVHLTETTFSEESFFSSNIKIIDSLTGIFGLLNDQNAVVKGISSLLQGNKREIGLQPNIYDTIKETYYNIMHYSEDSSLYNGRVPPDHLQTQNDKTATYSSRELDIQANNPPALLNYSFYAIRPKGDADTIYNSSYKVGKRMRIQIAAGLAYTFNHVWETTASTSATGDTFKIQNDEDRLRLVVGLKFYPIKGLYLSDSKFLGSSYGTVFQRLSIFTGFSLPSPLKNIYLGAGWDLLPGLNVNAGVHFYQTRFYSISNNTIDRESLDYKVAAPYAAITIDPQSLISIFKFIGQSF